MELIPLPSRCKGAGAWKRWTIELLCLACCLWGMQGDLSAQYAPRLRVELQAGYSQLRMEKPVFPPFPFYQETQIGHGWRWELGTSWRLGLADRIHLLLQAGQTSWFFWEGRGELAPAQLPRQDPYRMELSDRRASAFQVGVGVNWLLPPVGHVEPWLSVVLCHQYLQLSQAPRTLRIEGLQTRFIWQEEGYELAQGLPGLRLGGGFNYHFSPKLYGFFRAQAQGNRGQTEFLPATFAQFDASVGIGFRLFPSPSRFR